MPLYSADCFDDSDDELDENPSKSMGWILSFISWSRGIGYVFGGIRVVVERIFTAVMNMPPAFVLKLHSIFPALAYLLYGIKELLSFINTLTEITRDNYKEKIVKACVELAAAVLYLLTAATYGSLAFISLPIALVLAAVGTTISWVMLDVLKIGVEPGTKDNPVFRLFLVAGMWLFAINALLIPPVALLGMSAIAVIGTGCLIISAVPIIVIIAKASRRGISAAAKKLYSCCYGDSAVPDDHHEPVCKNVITRGARASQFMYPSSVSGGDISKPPEQFIYPSSPCNSPNFSNHRRGSLRFYVPVPHKEPASPNVSPLRYSSSPC